MTRHSLYSLVFIVVLLLAVVWRARPVQAQGTAGEILNRINALRATQNLPPYTTHPALTAAAQNQATWMAQTGSISHVQPDGSRPRDRAQRAGYSSSWVGENIYMGYRASVDNAWTFWINSPIHYAGLVNANYKQVGIASATAGDSTAFVIVFGNPGGRVLPDTFSELARNNNAGGDNEALDIAGAPPFVVGWDSVGNIQHQIQAGDTLGDIAIIYGYTWDDLPAMLELNEMTWDDVRVMPVGEIFLVPPKAGTYTPTPPQADSTATPDASATAVTEQAGATTNEATPTAGLIAPQTFDIAQLSQTPTRTPTPQATRTPPAPTTTPRTAAMVVRPLVTPTSVTIQAEPPAPATDALNLPPLWILSVIFVQVTIFVGATAEFIRRLWMR